MTMSRSARRLPERSASLADQVSDLLVDAISLGELRPGERMVEAEVARRFKVSRVPVREAFKILGTQGIVDAEPNRGVRVGAVDDLTIERVCEARLAVETMAIRALVASPGRLLDLTPSLDDAVETLRQAVEDQDLVGINRADIAFHTAICRTSGNKIAFTLWQAIARHVLIVFGREILSEPSLVAIVDQHRHLADEILAADEDRAVAALRAHVMRLRGRATASRGARGVQNVHDAP